MLKVEPQGITVNLAAGVEGYIRTSELSRDPVDDIPKKAAMREGQEIEAMFMAVDRKKRIITLSIKAREHKEEETALEAYGAAGTAAATTKLGDLLRPQLDVSETGKEHD